MIYLTWYLAIGVVILLVVYLSHRLSTNPEIKRTRELANIDREIKASIPRTKKTWRESLLDEFVLPLLAWIAILTAWPVALFMLAKDKLFPSEPDEPESIPEKIFSVARENLIRQMTVDEIEQQERVTDPMGAVPDLPFGHLNTAWSQFKNNLLPHDSIWSFAAQWTNEWERIEIREGYVVVRGNNIGSHILKSLRVLREEKFHAQNSGFVSRW